MLHHDDYEVGPQSITRVSASFGDYNVANMYFPSNATNAQLLKRTEHRPVLSLHDVAALASRVD